MPLHSIPGMLTACLADIYYKEQLKRNTKVVFPEDASIESDDI